MKKICFYCVATHLGGAERSVLELIKAIKTHSERGYSVQVLLPKSEGRFVEKLKTAGIGFDIIAMPAGLLQLTRRKPFLSLLTAFYTTPAVSAYLFRVQQYLRKTKPDIIYSTGLKCHLISAMIGPFLSIPVLWHLRDIFESGPTASAIKVFSEFSGVHLIANSKATAESFSSSIAVVHNGLDPIVYRASPNRNFNKVFEVADSVAIVGMIGVVARWKGQLEFLRMARQVLDHGLNVRFVIVGDEIYDTLGERGFMKEVRAEVKKLALTEVVHFSGYVDDSVEAINGLDVLVHASIAPEPFGRVVAEAMACKVAVVASRDGGIPELVIDEVSGLLSKPGDVNAMSSAVIRLLKDPDLRVRLAGEGHKRFLEHFTNKHYFDGMVGAFDRIINLSAR